MQKWQGMYQSGVALADATPYTNGIVRLAPTLTAGTLNISSGVLTHSGGVLLNGAPFASGVSLNDGTPFADGIILGDFTLFGDRWPQANQILSGDDTACAPPAP